MDGVRKQNKKGCNEDQNGEIKFCKEKINMKN